LSSLSGVTRRHQRLSLPVQSRLTSVYHYIPAQMASSLFRPLQGFAQSIARYHLLQDHSLAIGVAAALSVPVLYIARADYRAWLLLGRGGLPYNVLGWFVQLILTPFRAGRLDTSCYQNPEILAKAGPSGSKSYLSAEDVPQRKGPRPSIHRWLLPQRQADSRSSEQWKTVGLFSSTSRCIRRH
jgi:hypothetical protein